MSKIKLHKTINDKGYTIEIDRQELKGPHEEVQERIDEAFTAAVVKDKKKK